MDGRKKNKDRWIEIIITRKIREENRRNIEGEVKEKEDYRREWIKVHETEGDAEGK